MIAAISNQTKTLQPNTCFETSLILINIAVLVFGIFIAYNQRHNKQILLPVVIISSIGLINLSLAIVNRNSTKHATKILNDSSKSLSDAKRNLKESEAILSNSEGNLKKNKTLLSDATKLNKKVAQLLFQCSECLDDTTKLTHDSSKNLDKAKDLLSNARQALNSAQERFAATAA